MPVSKFHIVATEGQTIDGRTIAATWIDQMAETYNPKTYGARVWMEHYRSFFPDSPFKAYGDVLSVKADKNEEGKRVLLAQIDATTDLVKMNAERQKVYWSIEIDPNFAGSGKAYLTGLAVTDTPASLGTEMLTFAAKSDKATGFLKDHVFSAYVESAMVIDDQAKPEGPTLLSKVTAMLSGKGKTDDARFSQVESGLLAIAEEISALKSAPATFAAASDVTAVAADVKALQTSLADLTTKLSKTPAGPDRPKAGGADTNQTDC